MTKFAFIIHPLHAKHAAKKYPILQYFPDAFIETIMRYKKPVVMSHITGIESPTGEKTEGWFIACPLTPNQMLGNVKLAYERIGQCCEIAHELGAEIIGLGAFTSVVGDGGITVAKNSPIAVTTGNSYTVATSIQGALEACAKLGIDPAESTLAVVGATGSIGRTCAIVLAKRFKDTYLIGRNVERTAALAREIPGSKPTTDINVLKEADVIITVSSAKDAIIRPEHLKPGAIVCDVARPRDVSVEVSKSRKDVLVIEGGVVEVPGPVEFGMTFGFPEKTAYACMSETMMLALDGRAESFTLGKDVSVEQVEETIRLAEKHGFKLAGFRSFERAVTDETIETVKQARRTTVPL